MKKQIKTKSKISAYLLRSAAVALLFSCAIVGLSSAFNSSSRWSSLSGPSAHPGSAVKPEMQTKTLTFAERVVVSARYRRRLLAAPDLAKRRPDPKPSLDAVMSQAQLEKKVEDYLGNSQALEDYWHQPITAEQLQAEMDRMAQHTRQPEMLRELFEALGNDPFVIAECLARPVLTERLIADLSAQDKTRRFESARTKGLSSMSMPATLANAAYTLPKISEGDPPCTDDTWTAISTDRRAHCPSPSHGSVDRQ